MNIEAQSIWNRLTAKHMVAGAAIVLLLTVVGAYIGSKQGTQAAIQLTKVKCEKDGIVSAKCKIYCPDGWTEVPCN